MGLDLSSSGKVLPDLATFPKTAVWPDCLRISSYKFKPKWILARITESQLSWFGHVCRMSNMRLPKRILMEMVPGTNKQGRNGKMISFWQHLPRDLKEC